jgi:ribose transport system substrate-binding protein
MKKIKWITILCLALALVFAFAACTGAPGQSSEEPPAEDAASESPATDAEEPAEEPAVEEGAQIGVCVLNFANPLWSKFVENAENEAQKYGYEIVSKSADDLAEKQVEILENFISIGVKGIVVIAVDPVAIEDVVKSAMEKGIFVVSVTSKLAQQDSWCGTDEYDMGYTLGTAAGQYIADKWGTEERIEAGVLNYDILAQVIDRKKGIIEGVQSLAPNVEFVADQQAGDPTDGMAAAEGFMQANPDIRVILGINDGGALGAYEAFMAAGRDDVEKYLIGGIDATDEGLAKVKEDGIYKMTVDQQVPESGSFTVDLINKLMNGETVEAENYMPLKAVTIENVDEYLQ